MELLNEQLIKVMKLSVTQYARARGITRQGVLKQIKHGRSLPFVSEYEKIGETYFLHTLYSNQHIKDNSPKKKK
jgi:hypothetical protein